jgi:hypothetical protein
MAETPSNNTVYRRTLPGGGFVNVDVEDPSKSGTHRAYVAVERRKDPIRRDGHVPPVIATAEGTRQGVFANFATRPTTAVALALPRTKSDGTARF